MIQLHGAILIDERECAGLERFYALAAERGALASAPDLRFADTARVR